MFPEVKIWLAQAPWIDLLALLIDITLKSAAICLVAGIATLLLRRSSAFMRNMVWIFALVGLLLLPAFSVFAPLWNLPLIPELSSWGGGTYTPDFEKPDSEMLVGPPVPGRLGTSDSVGRLLDPTAASIPWYGWAILVWMTGGILYFLWCLFSYAGIRLIVRQAHPADDEWRLVLNRMADEVDLQRNVRLLTSEHVSAAITVGIINPSIVVPMDSNEWTESRRRLVLSHELAHVKRWDTLIETFALLATVMYWFNPLVWFAVKQLRIERERDCDNAVLGTGAKPSDYAELLMNIAADLGNSARPVWQLSTISQSSNLKDRIMSILNQKINRNRGSRRSAILTGLLVLALVLPISTSGLWNVNAQEDSKKKEKAKQEEMMKEKQMEKKKEHDMQKKKMSAEEAQAKMKKSWEKICANENSAACKVGTIIKKEGPEVGMKAFYKMKKAEEGEYYFDEKEFNTLGYLFLYHGKTDEAIAVFKLNVKEYPDSWNVYDSLGEGYLVAKKYDSATKYYKKALAMNPEAESAQKALEKLEVLTKK